MSSFLAIVASNAVVATLLALITVGVTRIWRSPQLAHGLWLVVLVKLITPPLITVSPPTHWLLQTQDSREHSRSLPGNAVINANDANDLAAASTEPSNELVSFPDPSLEVFESTDSVDISYVERLPAVTSDARAAPLGSGDSIADPGAMSRAWDAAATYGLTVFGLVWIAGSVAYLSLLVRRCVHFRRLLANSAPVDAKIGESATRLAQKLGLRRRHALRTVEATVPPLVWSLGLRPLIVLPSRLLAELSPAQHESLIAHELAHIRRRDDLVRWLELIALVVWWWNPVAWFARRKLREAEEECCDAWVVWALPGERRSYGEAMLATIDFLTDVPRIPALAESAFGTSFCKRRIEMIMRRNVNRKISWAALGLVVLTAMAVLPVVAQTSESNNAQAGAPSGDAAATGDASVVDDNVAGEAGITAESAVGSSGDAVVGEEPAGDAIEAAGDVSLDSTSANGETSSDGAFEPREALLQRIKRLEALHLAQESVAAGRRATGGGSSSAVAVGPRLPSFEVSPNEREQKLQEQLLRLDVEAAKSEVEQAQMIYSKTREINKNHPNTVAEIEVAQQRAAMRAKEIQLQRAEIVLALFREQAQRERERTEGRRSYLGRTTRWQTPGEVEPDARSRAAMDAKVKALRRDELARLKAQHEHVAKELSRLENLLKHEPESPATWEAVNRFLTIYRNLAARDATDEGEPQSRGGGSR